MTKGCLLEYTSVQMLVDLDINSTVDLLDVNWTVFYNRQLRIFVYDHGAFPAALQFVTVYLEAKIESQENAA